MEYTDIDDDSIFADFKMPDISVSNWWQKLITSEKNVQAKELRDHVDLWCNLPIMIQVPINIHCIDVF